MPLRYTCYRCSVNKDIASWDISASRNSTSDASDNGIPSSLSSDSAFKVATQREGSGAAITKATFIDEEPIDESVHPPSSTHPHHSELPVLEEFLIDHASPYLRFAPEPENCQISTEMDYLLIPASTDLRPVSSTSKGAELVQISDAFDLQYETEARSIIIATASLGYVEGVVFPASSLLRPLGSKNFQTLYCIESHNSMPKGTSGSAVFDRETGLLAGYIVLGCPEQNIWYMIPILSVLHDLEVRFGQIGNCQIQINVAAAVVSNLVDMVTANIKELPQISLLGGTAIQRDQESPKQRVSKSPKATQWRRINGAITSILKGFQPEDSVPLDHWSLLFGQKARSTNNDRLLLGRFRDLECAFLEAIALVLSHPQPTSKGHQMTEAPKIRDDQFAMIESSGATKSCNHNGKDGPHSTAWMVDILGRLIDKGKSLDKREIFALLEGKNLPSHNPDNESYTPQCFYIKNPDPRGIMILRKASCRFPMERFQELFFSHISKQPDPRINLTQDNWLGSAYYSIEINVPFLVIASRVELDKKPGRRSPGFRHGYSLSFLCQGQPLDFQKQNRSSWADGSYLYPGVCSVIIIGRSERYWTAACLDDSLADNTSMLSTKAEEHSGDITKPVSPRAYALESLARILEKVATYHHQVHLTLERGFEKNRTYTTLQKQPIHLQSWIIDFAHVLEDILSYNSKVLEKLDIFLSKELSSSPDGLPGNPLWASIYQDPGFSESLPRIQKSFSALCDTQSHLESLDGRIKNIIIKQNELLVDSGSTHWLTLTAFLVVVIALIYQMTNN